MKTKKRNLIKTRAIRNTSLLIIPLWVFSWSASVFGQKTASCVKEKANIEFWSPSKYEEMYEFKLKDTLKQTVGLIFEKDFDDSIQIKVNNIIIYKQRIKTSPNTSVVMADFEIDYSVYSAIPTICIILISKKNCIEFKPIRGYRLIYLNRFEGYWNIENSNYPRVYH